MLKVTVSAKGQIVIPAEIRKKYGLERGTKLEVRARAGKIEMEPLPRHSLVDMRGKFKGKTSLTQLLLEERRRDRLSEDE